jgi:hypothetical protein
MKEGRKKQRKKEDKTRKGTCKEGERERKINRMQKGRKQETGKK